MTKIFYKKFWEHKLILFLNYYNKVKSKIYRLSLIINQESHICFNKCSDFLILAGKWFIENTLIFPSKAFIDYCISKENEYVVNRIQLSVFRFLHI